MRTGSNLEGRVRLLLIRGLPLSESCPPQKIEHNLSSLLADITIPPALATLILDSQVREPWIEGIEDFERRLVTIKARSRVKAARDLAEVAEGLRIVVWLTPFFSRLNIPSNGHYRQLQRYEDSSLRCSGLFAVMSPQICKSYRRPSC